MAQEITRPRDKSMDGMRGILAVLVFLAHTHVQFHFLTGNRGFLFFASGALWCLTRAAVPIFFTLSSFLLYPRLLKKKAGEERYFAFLGSRFRRLYPAFLFVFLIYFALCFMFPGESKLHGTISEQAWYVAANLLMLQGLLHPPMIVQTWTLSYIWTFNVLLPLVIWAFRRLNLNSKQRLLALMVLWVAALGSIRFSGIMTGGMFFIVGMILHELLPALQGRAGKPSARLELSAGLLLLGIWAMLYVNYRGHTVTLEAVLSPELTAFYAVCCRQAALTLAMIVAFTLGLAQSGVIRSFLSLKPLVSIGTMSYSWYLCHGLALKATSYLAAKALRGSEVHGALLFASAAAVSFGLSWAITYFIFHFVEKKFSSSRSKNTDPLVRAPRRAWVGARQLLHLASSPR